jgi:hypothetical protein
MSVVSINTAIKYVAMKIRVTDFTSSENQKNKIWKQNLFVLMAENCVIHGFVCFYRIDSFIFGRR